MKEIITMSKNELKKVMFLSYIWGKNDDTVKNFNERFLNLKNKLIWRKQ